MLVNVCIYSHIRNCINSLFEIPPTSALCVLVYGNEQGKVLGVMNLNDGV